MVVIREMLSPGMYMILFQADEKTDMKEVFQRNDPRCDAVLLSLSISPMTKQQDSYKECAQTSLLDTTLDYDKLTKGTVTFDTNTTISASTYINLADRNEGPFLMYFSLEYDMRQEGPIAIILSKYSDDKTKFKEEAIFYMQEGSSQMFHVMDAATYVITIESLQS